MKITIKAKEIQPGDVIDGRAVLIVDSTALITIIYFAVNKPFPLHNSAEVMVERKLEKIEDQ